MFDHYPKECSIVFIMNLISALFSYFTPFRPFPLSIVATPIDVYIYIWSQLMPGCTEQCQH